MLYEDIRSVNEALRILKYSSWRCRIGRSEYLTWASPFGACSSDLPLFFMVRLRSAVKEVAPGKAHFDSY